VTSDKLKCQSKSEAATVGRTRPSSAGAEPGKQRPCDLVTRHSSLVTRHLSVVTRHSSLVTLIVVAALFAAACRLDMHIQPKYKPLDPSTFFRDGRSERPAVAGVVAHGHLRTDELLYTGKIDGVVADTFPFPITRQDLERGRERYNIYCSPCHDYTGSGQGMIVQRAFQRPPSYHIDRLRQAPAGRFFAVITNGYGAMYSYASRVSPEDRWRIAAYIRALQLSQSATLGDVPDSERVRLQGKGQ
jgi:cytochrome c553